MATKKGTGGNDRLKGTDNPDTLMGLAGNDILDGRGGSDELLGGNGNDLFHPGEGGADAMIGAKGRDTVSYAKIQDVEGVTLGGPNPDAITGAYGAAGDTFSSIENFIGTRADDFFSFNGNDTSLISNGYIYGGGGNDIIYSPNKVLRGDKGNDQLFMGGSATAETVWLQLNKGADIIYNMSADLDMLRVSSKEFSIGKVMNGDEFVVKSSDHSATIADGQFIFQSDTNELYWDEDGTGSDAAVLVATLANDYTPTRFDFEIV